ncbi:MAG: P-loop NTPase [Desulfurococcales archaeon]|nr:P-loop NTPase [Desulfurococcales archaeon]
MIITDPRPARIRSELSKRNTIVVLGAKGGVGKTTIAVMLGVALKIMEKKVLLVDLDITDPNMHVAVGVDPERVMPGEKKGIEPININGVGFISISPYAKGRPLPLRGEESINALRELLAATDYTGYDTVIIDTPPGAGDVTLDILNLLPNPKLVAVSTPSKFSIDSLRRFLMLLRYTNRRPKAVVYNMVRNERIKPGINEYIVHYDEELENAIGDLCRIAWTRAFEEIKPLASQLI